MGEAAWYYVDAIGARVGPVDAEAVREALRLHGAYSTSLVWREGMSEWAPLATRAAELGLPAFAAPPELPAPPVDRDRPPGLRHGEGVRPAGDDVVYAGFLRRFAALIVDQVLLAVVAFVLVVVLMLLGFATAMKDGGASIVLFYVLLYGTYFVCAAAYYAGMESSATQATLGKQALGIKVTDLDGRRINFAQALGRWFAAALSYLTLYVGFLIAAFTQRKQALHDFAAGTLVVDRWAYTATPERQQRGAGGCLVALLVGAVVAVPLVAILAAIAIAQYQDYVVRSQVSEASSLADGIQTAVAEYHHRTGTLPATNADAGLPPAASIAGAYVARVDVVNGEIQATFSQTLPQRANQAIAGRHLRFVPTAGASGQLEWQCLSTDLKQKWCPSRCDCSD